MSELDKEKLRRAFQLERAVCASPCARRELEDFEEWEERQCGCCLVYKKTS